MNQKVDFQFLKKKFMLYLNIFADAKGYGTFWFADGFPNKAQVNLL